MRDRHEPSDEFVDRLEWQIGREMRRRNRAADAPAWTPRSRLKTRLAVLALVLVSMGIGAAVVAAAYEAQDNQRRDQLTSGFEQRAALARQRLELATEQLKTTEQRVNTGLASKVEALESRTKVAEARAQLKSIELQLEEIRLTGREPRNEVSAPRVSGRDFVGERLRGDISAVEAALGVERARLQEIETRFQIGVADAIAVEVSRVHKLELEAAFETFQKKIDIRVKFLTGVISPVEAELRLLEAEAEQRRKTLAPKVELARKEMERAAVRVETGTGPRVELAEATLRRLELETELSKADLDLALVRRKIEQHRAGR